MTSIIAMDVAKDATDAQIRELFVRNIQLVKDICRPSAQNVEVVEIHLTISGYESDSRELYEIDEARVMCKKLIGMGLYGLLMLPGQYGKKTIMENFTAMGIMQAYFPLVVGYAANGVADNADMPQHLERVRISCDIFNRDFDAQI